MEFLPLSNETLVLVWLLYQRLRCHGSPVIPVVPSSHCLNIGQACPFTDVGHPICSGSAMATFRVDFAFQQSAV